MVTFYWNEEQSYKIIEMLKCKKNPDDNDTRN